MDQPTRQQSIPTMRSTLKTSIFSIPAFSPIFPLSYRTMSSSSSSIHASNSNLNNHRHRNSNFNRGKSRDAPYNNQTENSRSSPYANGKDKSSSSHWFSSEGMPSDPLSGPPLLQPVPEKLPENTIALLWFRNDLRLVDNAALTLGCTGSLLAPLYVFDMTKRYGKNTRSPWGFHRVGPFRGQFIKDCLHSLRIALRYRQSDMFIRQGDPAEQILSLARELIAKYNQPIAVIAQKETTWEEEQEEKQVEKGMKSLSEEFEIPMYTHWTWGGMTLHHPDDLPFNVAGSATPRTFTAYRKLIESKDSPVPVREEIPIPEHFPWFPLSLRRAGEESLPLLGLDLQVEGLAKPLDHPFPDPKGVHPFEGGIEAAEERITEYIWKWKGLEEYKDTRNKSGQRNSSSKFSPYFSAGVLSPRTIYRHVKEFEQKHGGETKHSYWMIFELMTRDYFRWLSASSTIGTKLFALNGFSGSRSKECSEWQLPPEKTATPKDKELFQKWKDGITGVPFVDANMRELKFTGFMSNRGRQNVASFLVHDLKFPDWRAGAEYFEDMLIDHDVASNWGNWAYVAGVGNDPRIGRKFNVVKQGMDYEPDGWFISKWCPELLMVPPPMIHEPFALCQDEKDILEIESYPEAVIDVQRAPKNLAESLIGKYDIPRSKEWGDRVRQDFLDAGVTPSKLG